MYYGIDLPQTRSGKFPIRREPKYPDDFDVLIISGPNANISLSSFCGRSSAAAAVDESDVVVLDHDEEVRKRVHRDRDEVARKRAAADYRAAVAADPTKRRICVCGCGEELAPCKNWRKKPTGYRPGHNKRLKDSQGLFINRRVAAEVARKAKLNAQVDAIVAQHDLFCEVA